MDQPTNETPGKRILIVEDEAAFRDILNAELTKEGFITSYAQDGEEGIEKIRAEHPDLVLLDIVMPKKDGFWVLEQMQGDPSVQSIPVIVLSNSGDVVELSRVKELGVKEILVKTVFGPEELMGRIHHTLNGAQAAPAQPEQEQPQASAPEPAPAPESAQTPAAPEAGNKDGVSFQGAVILLVEDDPFLWSLIQSKLVKEGFAVTVAKDGQSCLDQVKKIHPRLILLDIILPDLNGFTVLEKLKADKETDDIPVIILSNLGQQEDISKGVALGAKDYLIKAHHAPQEIVDKIKKILTEGK